MVETTNLHLFFNFIRTAIKPVEIRLLQDYDTSVTPDTAHGKPVTAPFGKGKSAILLILASNGAADKCHVIILVL